MREAPWPINRHRRRVPLIFACVRCRIDHSVGAIPGFGPKGPALLLDFSIRSWIGYSAQAAQPSNTTLSRQSVAKGLSCDCLFFACPWSHCLPATPLEQVAPYSRDKDALQILFTQSRIATPTRAYAWLQ